MLIHQSQLSWLTASLIVLTLGDPATGQSLHTDAGVIAAIDQAPNGSTSQSAVLYRLKMRLPKGEGLARMLIQAGVSQADAAAAAKLAAGRLGNHEGGCQAKIEISNDLGTGSYRLERAVLLTASAQTVIERRAGELTIASQQVATTAARLV